LKLEFSDFQIVWLWQELNRVAILSEEADNAGICDLILEADLLINEFFESLPNLCTSLQILKHDLLAFAGLFLVEHASTRAYQVFSHIACNLSDQILLSHRGGVACARLSIVAWN